ncbi:hypothetical protein T07_14703 [Trichinella nelsoni]|uniref:Uncharacterized protein n=1 Tax=Trichinella nelsoni TaxID=6336 RepID=A0A0V0RIF3_9BILA|nr:hypothetical protein T07_14703 [Trichinella nelsoni]
MTAMRGAFDRLLPLVGYDRSTRSLYRRLILVKTVEHFEYMRTQVIDTQKAKRERKIHLSTFQCSKCWEREAEISLSNYKNIERRVVRATCAGARLLTNGKSEKKQARSSVVQR